MDIWPLGQIHAPASTVNVALELAVSVELRSTDSRYSVCQGESIVEADSAAELCEHDDSALCGWVLDSLALPPVSVRIHSDSPRGAGLGASSALAMALIAAGEALLDQPASPAAARVALARALW